MKISSKIYVCLILLSPVETLALRGLISDITVGPALSPNLPSYIISHYLPTYHLTLSQTDQHLVLVSAREVDKNGRVSLNPSPFTAAAACYVKPFGTRLGWPLSNWGLNSTFTHSFISRAGYMSGTGQTRHGEGPIFLSTHLSDDNGGFHSRVKNNITQSRFSLCYLKIQLRILRRQNSNCLISTIAHLLHKVPALLRLKNTNVDENKKNPNTNHD